ncbi:MAG: biotin/lipoyl-binding protein, partial [Planctomycetota bacterium]
MTRTPARLVPLLLAGSVMWSGCTNQQSVEQSVATKSASPTVVRAVPVSTETVTRTSTQPATVRAFFTAGLRSKVDGYVRAVKADIGDAVRAGQVLAVVDVPEMVKRRAVLEARIERRVSNERQAEAGVPLAPGVASSTVSRGGRVAV